MSGPGRKVSRADLSNGELGPNIPESLTIAGKRLLSGRPRSRTSPAAGRRPRRARSRPRGRSAPPPGSGVSSARSPASDDRHPQAHRSPGRRRARRPQERPAQVERHRQVRLHAAAARAGAGTRQDLLEVAAGALAGDLDQAELGDLEDARAGAVPGQLLLEPLEHLAAVLGILHVDEVHDEDAAEVAQADLPGDLGDRLEVRREDRLLERVAADEPSRVDVDRDERLGLVDDDRAAGGERAPGSSTRLDLASTPNRSKIGSAPSYELDARRQRRGDLARELRASARPSPRRPPGSRRSRASRDRGRRAAGGRARGGAAAVASPPRRAARSRGEGLEVARSASSSEAAAPCAAVRAM